jgi:tetratricopeptide (TPR) repeat protein
MVLVKFPIRRAARGIDGLRRYGALAERRTSKRRTRCIIFIVFVSACCAGCQENDKAVTATTGGPLPASVEAQVALANGLTALDRGDQIAAIEQFTTAIHLDASLSKAYYWRAHARIVTGEPEAAVEDDTAAIRLDPGWPLPYLGRATAYRELRQFDKAIADSTEAIRIITRGNLMQAHFGRGEASAGAGSFDRAIADFDETLRLNPEYAPGYYERGNAYKAIGQDSKAQADFKRATELGYGGAPPTTKPKEQRKEQR